VLALVVSDINGCTQRNKAKAEEMKAEMTRADHALAYACGYVHGQRGIIAHARLKIKPPRLMDECWNYTEEAVAAGFNAASQDR